MQRRLVRAQRLLRASVGLLRDVPDLRIAQGPGLFAVGALAPGLRSQDAAPAIAVDVERQRPQLATHAPVEHHAPGHARDLLEIILRARGDLPADQIFGGPPAQRRGHLLDQIRAWVVVLVVQRQELCHTQATPVLSGSAAPAPDPPVAAMTSAIAGVRMQAPLTRAERWQGGAHLHRPPSPDPSPYL